MLPQPFAFDILDATFLAAGADLKDLYYLTGVHLPDTGDYRLSGALSRRALHTQFLDLAVNFGSSDVRGSLTVDAADATAPLRARPAIPFPAAGRSGNRAAGRRAAPPSPLLLSNAPVSLNLMRMGEITAQFRADELLVGRVPLRQVSLTASIDHALLRVTPLTAQLLGGRLDAHLQLDATRDVPQAALGLSLHDLQVGQFAAEGSAAPRPSRSAAGAAADERSWALRA